MNVVMDQLASAYPNSWAVHADRQVICRTSHARQSKCCPVVLHIFIQDFQLSGLRSFQRQFVRSADFDRP